ncbi:hypothetical membrane protein [Renibacterium salmoninarum ATCC 33209]|uniref:Hypothetical membrane protein n=1 Tax=Renibacterium salmoninarum (strain ATCC 33209 / DSM 20767 / JCM 11484 / NBRC 15589 / NCIMB 2235) TaxID=288705 RepID=A9WM29_RENSM|nr:hypothetical membrane protein [Renibacterium salmoninarum ATCC 33209]
MGSNRFSKTFLFGILVALCAVLFLAPPATATDRTPSLNTHLESQSLLLNAQVSATTPVAIADTKNTDAMPPTGEYEYFCINLGVGYNWNDKAPNSCPGWLDVYISGNHVGHINTGGSGGLDVPASCVLGGAFFTITAFLPGGVVVDLGWVSVSTTLAALGITILGCAGH